MLQQIDLEGRNIVITGSTGRLGQHIMAAFQDTKASLVTVDRSIHPELIDQYEIALATQADVTDEASVRDCFKHIQEEAGAPHVVVHTVGGWDGRPFLEVSLEKWNSMLKLNLTSAFLVFREALQHMQDGRGVLIGITAGQGADRGVTEQAAYSAAKGGLTRMIESIAAEFSGTGISAHAIAPSTILYEASPGQSGVPAEHIADLCVYLATGAARSLSGATLRAYGG